MSKTQPASHPIAPDIHMPAPVTCGDSLEDSDWVDLRGFLRKHRCVDDFDGQNAKCGAATQTRMGAKPGRSISPFPFEPDRSAEDGGQQEPRCNHHKGHVGGMPNPSRSCSIGPPNYLTSETRSRQSVARAASSRLLHSEAEFSKETACWRRKCSACCAFTRRCRLLFDQIGRRGRFVPHGRRRSEPTGHRRLGICSPAELPRWPA